MQCPCRPALEGVGETRYSQQTHLYHTLDQLQGRSALFAEFILCLVSGSASRADRFTVYRYWNRDWFVADYTPQLKYNNVAVRLSLEPAGTLELLIALRTRDRNSGIVETRLGHEVLGLNLLA